MSRDSVTWTLRAPDDVQELIEAAMAATGWSRQRLIFEVVRRELPAVVRAVAAEQAIAARKFEERPASSAAKRRQ
jgi:hypothetical protein